MKRLGIILCMLILLAGCAVPLARINGDRPTVSVSLDVTPGDAKVFLDGDYIGHAERFTAERGGLALTYGVHELRLEAEGYLPELFEVISAASMKPVTIRMLKKPEKPEAE